MYDFTVSSLTGHVTSGLCYYSAGSGQRHLGTLETGPEAEVKENDLIVALAQLYGQIHNLQNGAAVSGWGT